MREYFYNIDAEGRLFHDETELTDPAFLDFFFERLVRNGSARYREYPYLSPCGREVNYVRCDSAPIVYRRLLLESASAHLLYAGTSRLPFEPEFLRIDAASRLYYPLRDGITGRLGRHALTDLSQSIEEIDSGYVLYWFGRRIMLLS